VRSLRFEGVRSVDPDHLRADLATQPSDRKESHPFDADVFAVDQRRIEAWYRARGYYHARVLGAEVHRSSQRRWATFDDRPYQRLVGEDHVVDLVVQVEEGPLVRVAEVRVEGLAGEPAAAAQLGKLPLRPGMPFDEDRYDETRAFIEHALQRAGYPRPGVEQHAQVDPEANTARVEYQVDPGGRFRFGNVFVSGTAHVPRAVVRDAAGDALQSGAWYDSELLPKAQARVHDLGVFGGIRVTPGQPDPARGTIPILVSVREAPFRTIRAGPSLGFDASRVDASLVGGWTDRNWLGGLRQLRLDARVGWSWLQPALRFESDNYSGLAAADFTQPGVITRRVDMNARVELERRIELGYRYWVERLRVGLPMRLLGRTLSLFPSANLEYYQTRGDATQVQVGAPSQALLSCPGNAANPGAWQLCLLSYLEQRIDLDLRDDALETRRGIFLSVSLQEDVHVLGAGFRYLRLQPELRSFLPLGRTVLAARARLGLVQSYGGDQIPIVARLASGGPGQMRGYYSRRLSPVVALSSGGFAPVGGTSMLDGSAEWRFPLTGSLGGVLFLDAGNAYLSGADLWKLDLLQWAPGLGLRYRSALGPVRLDLAGRLPTRTQGGWEVPSVPVMRLGAGGKLEPTGQQHTEPLIGFHLSIGEAF
jgi:translocation and assembly module TamA